MWQRCLFYYVPSAVFSSSTTIFNESVNISPRSYSSLTEVSWMCLWTGIKYMKIVSWRYFNLHEWHDWYSVWIYSLGLKEISPSLASSYHLCLYSAVHLVTQNSKMLITNNLTCKSKIRPNNDCFFFFERVRRLLLLINLDLSAKKWYNMFGLFMQQWQQNVSQSVAQHLFFLSLGNPASRTPSYLRPDCIQIVTDDSGEATEVKWQPHGGEVWEDTQGHDLLPTLTGLSTLSHIQ